MEGGAGTLNLTAAANNYNGPTSVTDGPATGSVSTLILNGSNTGHGLVSVTNTTVTGTTVLSVRNANALGSGTANSGLAPINMDAYGTVLSASILEIGATIGTDPGGNNADFSYQLVEPEANQIPTNIILANGQISLGILGNSDDGTGFAAYNPTGARVVALYEDPNETYEGVQGNATTLATIEQKYAFGLGGGDHLTMGSSTANTTLVLLNPVDLQGGPQRRFASIRGVGIVPEGEYSGAISNSAGTALNLSFDGNGGLVFDSVNSSFSTATIQVNGGAIFVAANDPAQPGTNGAFGQKCNHFADRHQHRGEPRRWNAVPTTAGANLGFMTFGPDHGIGSTSPTVVTARNITVGGTGVNYASVVLGGASDDYTAMNGNILLNGNLGSANPGAHHLLCPQWRAGRFWRRDQRDWCSCDWWQLSRRGGGCKHSGNLAGQQRNHRLQRREHLYRFHHRGHRKAIHQRRQHNHRHQRQSPDGPIECHPGWNRHGECSRDGRGRRKPRSRAGRLRHTHFEWESYVHRGRGD